MNIQKVANGITGAEAADLLYQNDKQLADAVIISEEVEGAWRQGFYGVGVLDFNAAWFDAVDYRTLLVDTEEGEKYIVNGTLPPSSPSLAIVIFYAGNVRQGFIKQGVLTGQPPAVADNLTVTIPAGVTKMAVASNANYSYSVSKQTDTTIGQKFLEVQSVQADLQHQITDGIENLQGQIDYITEGGAAVRINGGENTDNPQYFKAQAEGAASPSITFLPNDGIFKDVLPFKRRFINTMTAPPIGTKFVSSSIHIGASRPASFTSMFWAKRSDWVAIFGGQRMEAYFGTLRSYSSPLIDTLLNDPLASHVSLSQGDSVEYETATATFSMPNRRTEDGVEYVQMRIVWTDIVWKSSFTGTEIPYLILFNGKPNFYNVPFDIYDLTLLFDTPTEGVELYADPDGGFGQKPLSLPALEAMILDGGTTPTSSGEVRALATGGMLYVASPYNATQELVKRLNIGRLGQNVNNPSVNIDREAVINKGGALTGGTVVKGGGDDITPLNTNAGYIGANHGWNMSRVLTLTAHGKTVADVGARYTDNLGRFFTILRVTDANNLIIVSDNLATNGYSYSFVAPNTNTLTYSSNGSSTTPLTGFTSVGISNLYTVMKMTKKTVLVNGKTPLAEDTVTVCDFINVEESYDIFDLPSIISKLVSGRPSGGYLSNPILSELGADKIFNVVNTYQMKADGSTLIYTNFYNYKDLDFSHFGAIQAESLTSGSLYVPKLLPVSDGVKTWDFRKGENWTTPPASPLRMVPAVWEFPASPPDRLINYNASTVFHTGYITDRGLGLTRKTSDLETAGFLNTTRKLYPNAISKTGQLPAGSFYSTVAFRIFTDPSLNPAGRVNRSTAEIGNRGYMWLDYSAPLRDRVDVPANWQGRKITVVEKSATVSLLSDLACNEITVVSTVVAGGNFGYLVLLFEEI